MIQRQCTFVKRFKTRCPLYTDIGIVRTRMPEYRFVKIGQGAFRTVYAVTGLRLVVKFPISKRRPGFRLTFFHGRNEYEAVCTVLREPKLAPLRRYMPEIYFHEAGVTVMKRYRPALWTDEFDGFSDTFDDLVSDLKFHLKQWNLDTGVDNFGRENGQYIFLDTGVLGYAKR